MEELTLENHWNIYTYMKMFQKRQEENFNTLLG